MLRYMDKKCFPTIPISFEVEVGYFTLPFEKDKKPIIIFKRSLLISYCFETQ